jgi:hypothetical protein
MENVEYQEVEEFQEEQKLPVLFKVISILSFIYIGINLMPAIFGLFSGPMGETELNDSFQQVSSLVPTSMDKKAREQALELVFEKQKTMNDKFYLNATVNIWVYSLGFFGVFKMFKKRQKSGYYLYIVYSVLSIFSMYIVLPAKLILPSEVATIAILSAIMVGLYTLHLKYLTK